MELIAVLLVIAIQWLFFFLFSFWGSLQRYKTILTFSTPEPSTGAHPEASELSTLEVHRDKDLLDKEGGKQLHIHKWEGISE